MKYLSVCSGIEAATVAWHPLGWEPLAFSEIEPFPRKVLSHHYPDVPLHGDFTVLRKQEWIKDADILVGGTPCQAFSVAGLRNSLDDDRGNLTLEFVRLADAIDALRSVPSTIVWENVPGVLSVKDNAFGCFLGALAGEDAPLVAPGGRWSNAGFVDGPKRAIAWRILDAQYFGVAQRRRRVFVIASARTDFDPAEVLFEFEGVRRDTAPSREKGKTITSYTPSSIGGYSEGVGTLRAHGGDLGGGSENLIASKQWPADISSTLDTTFGTKQGLENQHINAGCPMFVPAQPIAFEPGKLKRLGYGDAEPGLSPTLRADAGDNQLAVVQPIALAETIIGRQPHNGGNGDGFTDGGPMYTLNATGVHGVAQPIAYAFDSLASNSMKSANPLSGCNEVNVSKALDTSRGLDPSCNQGGIGVAQPIMAGGPSGGNQGGAAIVQAMAVRRLTPRECERLQGFPDDYTAIPRAADGPRYKALGNSMAVPVMAWIGKRIANALA